MTDELVQILDDRIRQAENEHQSARNHINSVCSDYEKARRKLIDAKHAAITGFPDCRVKIGAALDEFKRLSKDYKEAQDTVTGAADEMSDLVYALERIRSNRKSIFDSDVKTGKG